MMKIVGAILAAAITLTVGTASTAFAGSTAAESSHMNVRAEWDKSRAHGGYGFPLTAVPASIAVTVNSAFTGKDSRGPIAQSNDLKAASN